MRTNHSLMQRWMLLIPLLVATAASATPASVECPAGAHHRSPEQVLEDHRAFLAAGDVERDVMCNYAADAVVVSDMGVDQGRDAIRASLQGLVAFFGGAVPAVHSEIVVTVLNDHTQLARVLFSVETPCIDVPDGTDTYLIRKGLIHGQTAHGFPVFKCGPPPF